MPAPRPRLHDVVSHPVPGARARSRPDSGGAQLYIPALVSRQCGAHSGRHAFHEKCSRRTGISQPGAVGPRRRYRSRLAALSALNLDRRACREHALRYTWEAATRKFAESLALASRNTPRVEPLGSGSSTLTASQFRDKRLAAAGHTLVGQLPACRNEIVTSRPDNCRSCHEPTR